MIPSGRPLTHESDGNGPSTASSVRVGGTKGPCLPPAARSSGSHRPPTVSNRPVMWEKGEITDLGTLGGSDGVAYAINQQGVACGFSALVSGEHRAALYADGNIVDLGTLGGSFSQCLLGASNRGQFLGSSTVAGDVESHAFVTVDGVMTDLNLQIPADSGWLLEYAYGLNERWQIVGAGHRDGVAPIRAFLLSRGTVTRRARPRNVAPPPVMRIGRSRLLPSASSTIHVGVIEPSPSTLILRAAPCL